MSTPKISMRGIVHSVGDIEYTGEKNDYAKQRVILYCPAQRDQHTQQPIGKDEFFPIDIMGKKVDELNIDQRFMDQVVQVEIRFSGFCYNKKDGSGRAYGMNCHLVNMSIITAAASEYTADAVEMKLGY